MAFIMSVGRVSVCLCVSVLLVCNIWKRVSVGAAVSLPFIWGNITPCFVIYIYISYVHIDLFFFFLSFFFILNLAVVRLLPFLGCFGCNVFI